MMPKFPILRSAFIGAAILAAPLSVATSEGDPASHAITDKVSSGVYKMDVTHGYVTFTYNHFGFSNPQLRFEEVDANLTLDAENPAGSSVDVTINAASISSAVEVFDGHLNSDQWFDTAKFPTITFKSTALEQIDETTGTLTGDLTVKDVTKPVVLEVEMLGYGPHPLSQVETVGVEATTTVLRSDFGLGGFVPVVGDEVTITISGEFNKVAAEE